MTIKNLFINKLNLKKINLIRPFLLVTVFFCLFNLVKAQSLFNDHFEDKSLRIDFATSGDANTQHAALQQLREEPLWSGPIKNLIDPFNYGNYCIKVFDEAGKTLLFSKTFNTLFEEWRTTAQAQSEQQSWSNSISIPYPKNKVIVELFSSNKKGVDTLLMHLTIDPKNIDIDRGSLVSNKVYPIQIKGDMHQKVDLVFLAEGYTKEEMDKFHADAKRFSDLLFKTPPFDKHQDDFNIRAVELVSEESGTDFSGEGIFKNTGLNSGFYTFGVDRYLTTKDFKSIRDAIWNVPCDAIFILVNSSTYGGGGMYNFYAIGTADHAKTADVFVHEFGHSFAGLADEYYDSEVAYNDYYDLTVEPREPNLTTLIDFSKKWKNLVSANTPIPTPADEKQYDQQVGAFEGGGYTSKGVYRPMVHCMMRDLAPFCPVCSKGIKDMIKFWTDN